MNAPVLVESRVRCRPIRDDDLEAVASLLGRGFPGRGSGYFLRGLQRVQAREAPDGMPKFGYLLELAGRPVGAVLLIFSQREDMETIRCNIASWYVEPEHRGHAAMLSAMALKHKTVTYYNVTPAPNTWPILEAQGYRRYCSGLFLAFPALKLDREASTVEFIGPQDAAIDGISQEEGALLREAAGLGCLSMVVRSRDEAVPLAFLPFRMRSGRLPLPLVQLVYARSQDDFRRHGGAIGRALMLRGRFGIFMDANGPVEGIAGIHTERRGRKYCKGPGEARLNDLLDTELVLFGM